VNLTAGETRVLGCLLEKQRTTPDVYPLSLNALRLACNQSTNREPVVDYDEATIRDALHRLERRRFVRLASGAGSRAAKYRHLLNEALPMDDAERAILCVLMLRGAQTPGELKQRAERMHAFAGLSDVHDALARLIARELALRLERRPGQKEERYEQLLQERSQADAGSGQRHAAAGTPVYPAAPGAADAASRAGDGATRSDPPAAGPSASEPSAITLEALDERLARLERAVQDLLAVERAAMRHPSTEQNP
jgi:uncharacterized protein YceH (UPF0502 family)